jgi:hypothetical protein
MGSARIRKSVSELSTSDLAAHPVWEFALDEEGEDGQDETTVRPLDPSDKLEPSTGMFVVRARFRLADGSEHRGCLTPPVQGDNSLGTLQPVIVTDQGQVLFWWGAIMPPRVAIAQSYERLGKKSPSDVFPIHFSSDIQIAGGAVQGELPGFLFLEDWETGRTKVMK